MYAKTSRASTAASGRVALEGSTGSSSSGIGVGLRPAHRGAVAADEGVAQDAQQVAEVVVVAQEARLDEDLGEGLLHEVLGVLARAAQRPRGAVEPVDVIAKRGRIELAGRTTHDAPSIRGASHAALGAAQSRQRPHEPERDEADAREVGEPDRLGLRRRGSRARPR